MIKEHLTSLQVATLSFFLTNTFLINIGYNYLTNISNTTSFLDILLGGIFTLLFLYLINLYKNKNKDKNLIEIINSYKFFKWLLYPILILILTITINYTLTTLTSFIHYYILKEVEIITITITLLAAVLYLVKKGIPTITKVSEIFFYIYLFFIIISWIGLFNKMDFTNLKPLFTTSIDSHLKSSSIFFISTITPLFLLLMIKKNSIKTQKKDTKRLPFTFTIISIILTTIQLIIIISVLGIKLTNIYQNPDMIVYKKIAFLNLLDRVEVLLSFNNILNSFFLLVMCLYTLKEVTINIIKTKKEHIVLALLGIILLILGNAYNTTNILYLRINIITLILFIILFIKQLFTNITINS